MRNYRPLAPGLKIKDSHVHGQGLFTDVPLLEGTYLGLGYFVLKNGFKIRLPLGSFINHSDEPNVRVFEVQSRVSLRYVFTSRDIDAGEEILIRYEDWDEHSYGDGENT